MDIDSSRCPYVYKVKQPHTERVALHVVIFCNV